MRRYLPFTLTVGLCTTLLVLAGSAVVRGQSDEKPPLKLSLDVFPQIARDGNAAVAAVVHVAVDPLPESDKDRDKKRNEKVDLQIGAYQGDAEKPVASQKLSLSVGLSPSDDAYDVLGRLSLAPGTYEIRVTGKSNNRTGATTATVDVPDYRADRLAVSMINLNVSPGVVSGPDGAVNDLFSPLPSLRRSFTAGERVVAMVRLRENGDTPLEPVHVASRLTTDANQGVETELKNLGASAFGSDRVADYLFTVPLGRLTPRGYVLSIEFNLGGAIVNRTLAFTVR